MQLYLITGFLGAGKTTFLKQFLKLFQEKRIHLIINEFGKVGVDGALLQEVQATLDEINNGSIFCACRLDKFEQALVQAVQNEPEVILVEASGLTDPTNIRKVLSSGEYSAINYCGGICLVDVPRFEKVVSTARVCPKQLAVSSLALLNKTDIASAEQLAAVCKRVREINPNIAIRTTQFGNFDAAWLADITPTISENSENAQGYEADITLQKACLIISPNMQKAQLNSLLRLLAEDTYRIKGFVCLNGQTLLVDCTGPTISVTPYNGETNGQMNAIVLLAGKGMPLRKTLKTAMQLYGDVIKTEA